MGHEVRDHGPIAKSGKRIYNCTGFKRDMKEALRNFPEFLKIVLFNKEIRRLVKKIMLIVSSVNGCVYCKWFHTKMAIWAAFLPKR
jgi:hypothetical protein